MLCMMSAPLENPPSTAFQNVPLPTKDAQESSDVDFQNPQGNRYVDFQNVTFQHVVRKEISQNIASYFPDSFAAWRHPLVINIPAQSIARHQSLQSMRTRPKKKKSK